MKEKKKYKKYISKKEAQKKLEQYCAYQDRSHQEVEQKLRDLGIYGDDFDQIIAKLIEDNFLNEERFAISFAGGKYRIKKWGRIRIKRELKRRNISDYCIRKAMIELDEGYEDTLAYILRKKNRELHEKDTFKRNGKLARFAIQRGFEPKLVWEMLKIIDFTDGQEPDL